MAKITKIIPVKGMTLIELVVSMGILGIVGGMSAIILFTTLKNASKSDIMREVKQNGDYAMSIMERMIRNSQTIVVGSGDCSTATTCSGSGSCIKISNPDGQKTTFNKETVTVGSLTINKIASNSGSFLTNDSVTVTSGLSFTCTKSLTSPPFVTIDFTLSQAGSPTRVEERASINFHTSVSLRTY